MKPFILTIELTLSFHCIELMWNENSRNPNLIVIDRLTHLLTNLRNNSCFFCFFFASAVVWTVWPFIIFQSFIAPVHTLRRTFKLCRVRNLFNSRIRAKGNLWTSAKGRSKSSIGVRSETCRMIWSRKGHATLTLTARGELLETLNWFSKALINLDSPWSDVHWHWSGWFVIVSSPVMLSLVTAMVFELSSSMTPLSNGLTIPYGKFNLGDYNYQSWACFTVIYSHRFQQFPLSSIGVVLRYVTLCGDSLCHLPPVNCSADCLEMNTRRWLANTISRVFLSPCFPSISVFKSMTIVVTSLTRTWPTTLRIR